MRIAALGLRLTRHVALMASCVLPLALLSPASLRAQESEVIYASSDLETPPKIATPTFATKLLQDSYPDALRRAGVGGVVQLQFIVGSSGKVEQSSVEVIEAPVEALGDAAKKVVTRIAFKPGLHNGQPVRARVLLPLVYKAR